MKEFKEPYFEVIKFTAGDVVVASGDENCTQGMHNTGWACGGDKTVTCPNSGSEYLY